MKRVLRLPLWVTKVILRPFCKTEALPKPPKIKARPMTGISQDRLNEHLWHKEHLNKGYYDNQ